MSRTVNASGCYPAGEYGARIARCSQDRHFTVFVWSPCENMAHAHRVETLLMQENGPEGAAAASGASPGSVHAETAALQE
ncbi:MAG TPA: hypothetical protein VFS20_19210 [Longimicrobium sp.]|nr:hypothetical protein [Longimicrobium sp.]